MQKTCCRARPKFKKRVAAQGQKQKRAALLGSAQCTNGTEQPGHADRNGDLSPAIAQEKIEVALESGITLFDHADIYGDGEAEALFGRVLASQPSLREKMLIALVTCPSMII